MRLKKLHVKNYKNLKDFTLDFESGNGLTMLIGNNGSGKSNVLEAISGIFHDAYKASCQRKLNDLRCEYSIIYELSDNDLEIKREKGILRFWVNGSQRRRDEFIRTYMPKNVIGVYSGEEDRLWTNYYEPYYKAYVQRIRSGLQANSMRLMFINKYYWNIALLTLLISQNTTLAPFVRDELHIRNVEKVVLHYDQSCYDNCSNDQLKALMDRINPKHAQKVEYSIDELKEEVFFDQLCDEEGNFLTDENGNRLTTDSGYTDQMFFNLFVQACMPKKDKIINGIEIHFNDNLTTEQLSEGEKKLILVKAILEIVADEKSLLLFDEPDAHLHEGRKNTLYSLMCEYPNRQIVLATHSPTFVDIAESEQIKLIKNDVDGNAYVYEADKVEAIRQLTGSRFNAFLEKPILFCEGTSSSVESELYPILFPDYKVIPSGGHDEVIRNVKGYNTVLADGTHGAIGIIDWDYKNDAQLTALKSDKIYSLKVVEIENVLMDIYLLNVAKEQFCAADDSIEKVKQDLFSDCEANKEYQAKKYTANRIVSNIKSQISPDGRTIEDFKSNIACVCNPAGIDTLYNTRLACLEKMVRESEFENIISIYDFNHKIDRFVKEISNDYQNKILRLIKRRGDLQEFLKHNYYSDIPAAE